MVDQPRHVGAVLAKPLFFLGLARQRVEHPLGDLAVAVERALSRGWKPTHADRAVERLAGWKLVPPADVVGGAGREDGDVVRGRQPLGDGAAVRFGPSGD